jgi:hypothetical protein
MKHTVFTVYDSKSEAYLQPFFLQTKGQAVRAFTDSVNDPQHQFCRHPEDYTLFELGEYDDFKGSFKIHKTPQVIGKALEFKEME